MGGLSTPTCGGARGGRGYSSRGSGSRDTPFRPYPSDRSDCPRRSGSSGPPPPLWLSATRDSLDACMDDFKSALSEFDPSLSGPIWNDSLAWLADFKQSAGFDRISSLPQVSDYTQKALSSTRLLAQACLDAPPEDPVRQ